MFFIFFCSAPYSLFSPGGQTKEGISESWVGEYSAEFWERRMALSCITAVLWYRILSVIKSLEGSVWRKSLARFLVL